MWKPVGLESESRSGFILLKLRSLSQEFFDHRSRSRSWRNVQLECSVESEVWKSSFKKKNRSVFGQSAVVCFRLRISLVISATGKLTWDTLGMYEPLWIRLKYCSSLIMRRSSRWTLIEVEAPCPYWNMPTILSLMFGSGNNWEFNPLIFHSFITYIEVF